MSWPRRLGHEKNPRGRYGSVPSRGKPSQPQAGPPAKLAPTIPSATKVRFDEQLMYSNIQFERCVSDKDGETYEWTIHGHIAVGPEEHVGKRMLLYQTRTSEGQITPEVRHELDHIWNLFANAEDKEIIRNLKEKAAE